MLINKHRIGVVSRGVARISGRGVLKNFSAAAHAAYARART